MPRGISFASVASMGRSAVAAGTLWLRATCSRRRAGSPSSRFFSSSQFFGIAAQLRRHERPQALEPLPVEADGEPAVALLLDELVGPVIPDLDGARAVLAPRGSRPRRSRRRADGPRRARRAAARPARAARPSAPPSSRALRLARGGSRSGGAARRGAARRRSAPPPSRALLLAERLRRRLRIPFTTVLAERHGGSLPASGARSEARCSRRRPAGDPRPQAGRSMRPAIRSCALSGGRVRGRPRSAASRFRPIPSLSEAVENPVETVEIRRSPQRDAGSEPAV